MTEFVAASSREARRRALVRALAIGAALAFTVAAERAVAAEPEADTDAAAPAVQQGTVPGVDEVIVVPRGMHHSLRATVDEEGNVELEGRRGAPAVQPAPAAEAE